MAVDFSKEVERYGSVAAAREALGYTQNANGAWQAPANVEQRAEEAARANTVEAKAAADPKYGAMYQAAHNNDWDKVGSLANGLIVDAGYGDGTMTMKYADDYIRQLQEAFNYNANDYHRGLYDAVYGPGAWDGGTGTGLPVFNDFSANLVQKYNNAQSGANNTPVLDNKAFAEIVNTLTGNTSPTLSASSTQYAAAPEYEGSKWDAVLDSLAQQLLGMNYEDWTKGDQYKALANRYGQQGQMSMRDVLGQISSRTGGMASSYATTAAQQQYNNFMSQLEDAAMEMYGVEQGDLLDKANLARQYAADDYNRFQDSLDQWNADRSFDFNATKYAEESEKSDLVDMAETLAAYGDFSGYKALGYTDEQIANMTNGYKQQMAARNAPRGDGGDGSDDEIKMTLSTAKAMAEEGRFTDAVIQTLINNGFDEEYIMSKYGWEGYETAGNGYSMDFNELKSTIERYLALGGKQRAQNILDAHWDSLTEAQQEELSQIYN